MNGLLAVLSLEILNKNQLSELQKILHFSPPHSTLSSNETKFIKVSVVDISPWAYLHFKGFLDKYLKYWNKKFSKILKHEMQEKWKRWQVVNLKFHEVSFLGKGI